MKEILLCGLDGTECFMPSQEVVGLYFWEPYTIASLGSGREGFDTSIDISYGVRKYKLLFVNTTLAIYAEMVD